MPWDGKFLITYSQKKVMEQLSLENNGIGSVTRPLPHTAVKMSALMGSCMFCVRPLECVMSKQT